MSRSSSPTTTTRVTRSRAVLRTIEGGTNVECSACEQWIRFAARKKRSQVICNVYVAGRWNRVEHYHEDCYVAADEPYGPAT